MNLYDPDPIRVFLIGSRSFGCAVRDLIVSRSGFTLVGVCAPEGDTLATSTVVPRVHTAPPSLGMLPPQTDVILAAHNHQFIPPDMLSATQLGGLSYHPSLLPLHRGRDAIRWTIRDRDRISGGSIYWLDEHVDGGPIAAQDWCFVRPEDTASTLWQRELFPMGLRLFDRVLSDILSGQVQRRPQDPALATWEPRFDRPGLMPEVRA